MCFGAIRACPNLRAKLEVVHMDMCVVGKIVTPRFTLFFEYRITR